MSRFQKTDFSVDYTERQRTVRHF